MIWLIGGTIEARIAAEKLAQAGHKVLVTTSSEHGKDMFGEPKENLEIISGKLDADAMLDLLKQRNIELIVDASHPFAEETTKNALDASKKAGIKYIRFERPKSSLPEHDLIHRVSSYKEAAELAANFGPVIFLTTGIKNLEVFVEAAKKQNAKVVARVFSLPDSINHCLKAGLTPNDIVAVKGSFSQAFNEACFKEYKATVLVTKESGDYGGVKSKVDAAIALGIPVVIIERPAKPAGINNIEKLVEKIEKEVRGN